MASIKRLQIQYVPLDSLVPFASNPRTHTDEQVAQIAASIEEFGWTNPILTDGSNGIVAGHGRLLAAIKLGMVKVPTIELKGLSEAQRRAYVIADNKLALNAGWDDKLLAVELGELADMDFDLEVTGFGLDELESLFARAGIGEGLTDEDDAPEAPAEPVSRLGDVWLCGKHRLRCGDATAVEDVEALLAGVEPHLMVTDPPYGVEYDPDWRNRAERPRGKPYGGRAIGKVINDDRADWREAWMLFPGEVAYVWHPPGANSVIFHESLVASGFEVRMQIIWAKSRFPIGRGHYHVQHEPCWYAVRKGKTGHWAGSRKESTLWEISHMKSETGHSTQKPVECMRRPIDNNSSPGQAVYDPFLGSGTTMIAAETTGRVCYGMEISPAYVDVAVQRWQSFTGGLATLEADGRVFDEIKEALPYAIPGLHQPAEAPHQ